MRSGGRGAETDAELLECSQEVVGGDGQVGVGEEPHLVDAPHQRLEPEEQLAPREGRAHAEVRAEAERQMLLRVLAVEVEPGVLFAQKLPKILLPKNLEIEILGQILALEFYRKVHDVNWTYVTPPKNFTNGPRTGVFRIGSDRALEDRWGRTRISRADFAVALVNEAEQAGDPRRRISVAY